MKLNVKLVKDTMRTQTVYDAWIDFDATHARAGKLGYYPIRHPAGRPKDGGQQEETGNLTFTLRSGAKVNIFPKREPHRIQITWINSTKKQKHLRELENILVPSKGKKLLIIPWRTNKIQSVIEDQDTILDKLYSDGLI